MDTLKIIKAKIDQFNGHDIHEYLSAIYSHLSVAERHYQDGVSSGDASLFNDVIYRCNQAFEGILREAYGLYSAKDKTKPKTHEIEEYFETENILRIRVIDLLRNYRTQWRNPSTHNYWLTFDSSESLVSILSIQAFVAVLLDQVIQRYFFEESKALSATASKRAIPAEIVDAFHVGYIDIFSSLPISSFSKERYSELRLVGEFVGRLASMTKTFDYKNDFVVKDNKGHRVGEFDLLISSPNCSVPVEFKLEPLVQGSLLRSAQERFVFQLLTGGFDTGILCYVPKQQIGTSYHAKRAIGLDNKSIELHIIFPDNRILGEMYSDHVIERLEKLIGK